MPAFDDLLQTFRTDVPDAPDGAAERIAARVHGGAPSPRRRRIPRVLRLAALPVAAALAVSLVVALSPAGERSGTSGNLLAQADAAVSAGDRILALRLRIDFESAGESGSIAMRQWSLAGRDRAMALRVLITDGPLDAPPTDEDSTLLIGPDGRVEDQRSWTPLDENTGELVLGGELDTVEDSPSLAGLLRDAYRRGTLQEAGRTADGSLRLRGALRDEECDRTEVTLDPDTFIPSRMVSSYGGPDCRGGAGLEPVPERTETWTVSAKELPVTEENLRLLEIGDWPVERAVRWNGLNDTPQIPLDQVPPAPPLER